MAKHSSAPDSAGSGPTAIAALIIAGLALLLVYFFIVPEGSSALHSVRTTSGETKWQSIPSMAELDSLPFTDSNGSERTVSVLKDCADKGLGEALRQLLGIDKSRLSEVVQERPKTFCRSILQHWYLEGSVPLSSYPINWIGLVRALNDVGLTTTATDIHSALKRFEMN